MSINALRDYLDRNRPVPLVFAAREIDHPLVTTYQIIEWTVRDQCDIVEVTPAYVAWNRQGVEIGRLSTPVSFRPYFEKVLSRDEIVHGHVIPIEQTEKRCVYKIV
jgi:hypothetical protein